MDLYNPVKSDCVGAEMWEGCRNQPSGSRAPILVAILEEVKGRRNDDTISLFYLGHCYFRAKRWGEAALPLGPRPRIAFQAHGSLGMVFYETGDYQRAKRELEIYSRTAASDCTKQAHIWKWLESTCKCLGLKEEARRYGQLARPS